MKDLIGLIVGLAIVSAPIYGFVSYRTGGGVFESYDEVTYGQCIKTTNETPAWHGARAKEKEYFCECLSKAIVNSKSKDAVMAKEAVCLNEVDSKKGTILFNIF